ncbi:hypothetical protein BHM03_00046170 [Ensete ventricosum]|nr:hypothetical protein BHM03_00046170 [Ensete ventricosum]
MAGGKKKPWLVCIWAASLTFSSAYCSSDGFFHIQQMVEARGNNAAQPFSNNGNVAKDLFVVLPTFWMNICLLFYEEWWDNKSYAVTELFGCTFKVTSRLDSNKNKKNSIANHGAPVIRVNKQNRAAGVLENFGEGEKYAEHGLRKFVRNKAPEIMPAVNKFFSDPK